MLQECCNKGLLQLISQGWKWAPWNKALKVPEQWKMLRHYVSIRMASHFGFLNEKTWSHFCQCVAGLMLIVFSLFRGYHKHKSGNKYSLHRTGVLACPQPPLYPHIHKFSGTCPCLEKGRERVIEMIHCKSKLTAWQPCISWMGWMASGSGCHLPPPGFLHLFIQCYSTGDIRHKCGKMSFAVRKLGEGSPHNVLS